MRTQRTLTQARRRLQFERTQGMLGKLGSDGTKLLRDLASGRYWVRPYKSSGELAPAVPLPLAEGQTLLPFYNLMVNLSQDKTGQTVIIGNNNAGLSAQGVSPFAANPGDPAAQGYIGQELLTPFLCRPHASEPYYAVVYPGVGVYGSTVLDKTSTSEINLTSYKPGAGQHRYVTVFMDSAGALSVAGSTAQANTAALDETDLQECLDTAPAGGWPLRAFVMDGDLSGLEIKTSKDLRNLWGPFPDIAGLPLLSTPDATADSVMVYDASAGRHKKMLLEDLPGGGEASGGGIVTTTTEYELGVPIYSNTRSSTGNWTGIPIPSGYKRLLITVRGRSDRAAVDDQMRLFFNGDTTDTNYRYAFQYHGSATTGGAGDAAFIGYVGAATSPANVTGVAAITVIDPDGTHEKLAIADGFVHESTGGDTVLRTNHGINWENVAAITSIDVGVFSGTGFIAGSIIEVIGYKDVEVITGITGGDGLDFALVDEDGNVMTGEDFTILYGG